MPRSPIPGLYPIRGVMSVCHLLVDEEGATLIDTGLVGEPHLVRRRLRRLGLPLGAIRAILLTHGHLDHAGNLAAFKEQTGATVYGHAAEQRHVDGTYPYTGTALWCGRLEAFGRRALHYRSAAIDRFFVDGDRLPFWGGLEAVYLPGHTEGHFGFYSARHDLLFSGDLFASYFWNVHLPPPILNSRPEQIPASLRRVATLAPRQILPNHYDFADGALHRRRFERIYRRVLGDAA